MEFKNDKYTPNDDVITLNEVGTIREQYDWLPRKIEHSIDEEIVEKLQPVIRFLNHAAELVSTKVRASIVYTMLTNDIAFRMVWSFSITKALLSISSV